MNKIEFKDLPDITTPFTASLFNTMQDNIEEAINSSDVYLTDEIVIGKWIDNRPVYRKTIYISSFPNASLQDYPTGINNLDFAIKIYGNAGYLMINGSKPDNSTKGIGAWIGADNNKALRIHTGTEDRSNLSGYAVIEYVKTTD